MINLIVINFASAAILTISWQPDAIAAKGSRPMKFWFTRKAPKVVYDGKAPYDATVEQVLRVAREVNTAPTETDGEVFDLIEALHQESAAPPASFAPAPFAPAPFAPGRPTVSRAAREEMERRVASYRAFQIRLNEEREARIRLTMDNVRATLKQSAQDSSPR